MTLSCDDAGTSGVQRFEVFTGAGKRRDWPPEVKVSIVAESYSGQESVSAVARRHGMIPSQLFTWRRELRKQMEAQGFTLPVGHLEEPSDYVQLGAGGGGSGRVVPIPLHRSADFLDGADR